MVAYVGNDKPSIELRLRASTTLVAGRVSKRPPYALRSVVVSHRLLTKVNIYYYYMHMPATHNTPAAWHTTGCEALGRLCAASYCNSPMYYIVNHQ